MRITYDIRPEHNLVIFVHTGKISDDEFLAFYKDLYESTAFDLSLNQLIDLREADSKPRSSEALRQFANVMQLRLEDLATRPKVAVIAPKELSFGLAMMYKAFADSIPWDFVVFRAIDAALAWLGVPEDLMNDYDKNAHRDMK